MSDTQWLRKELDVAATGAGGAADQNTSVGRATSVRNFVPGELLVQFRPDADASAREAALASVGGRAAEIVRPHGFGGVDGPLLRISFGSGISVQKAIEILSHRPGVSFAEPNYTLSIDATSNDPAYTGGQLWGMYGDRSGPANPYGSQAGEAWAAGQTGSSKVVVGVVDTGLDYTHPDLYLNVWLNQREIPKATRAALIDVDGDGIISFRDLNSGVNAAQVRDVNGNGRIDGGDLLKDVRWANGLDDEGNGYIDDLIGWDFSNNDNDPYDDNNHGTHVSGTIAAIGGNATGVAGVTWAAQIIPLKYLGADGSGTLSGAIRALDYYTAASKSPQGQVFAATNNSWGSTGGFSQSLFDSISAGARQNILFVAAAGNGGADSIGDNNDDAANYPSNYNTATTAGYDAVVAVASLTSSGALSSFSNFGRTSVDLAAPGSGIYSTISGGGYGTFSGTSMATPHVTGAIALYAAVSSQSAADIKSNLLASVIPTASLTGLTLTGGRLDAANFISKVPPDPVQPQPPTGLATSEFGSAAASGGWTSQNLYTRTLADVNGDGRVDIVGFGEVGTYVALANANGTFGASAMVSSEFGRAPGAGGWTSQDQYPRMLADVNGDGRVDLVGFGIAGTYVALGNGSGGFGRSYLATANFGTDRAAGGWTSQGSYSRTLADVNGDGRADIVGFGEVGVYVALANANGTSGASSLVSTEFGRAAGAGGWSSTDRYPRMVADVNGDNRIDIVGFGEAGTYVALGNGSGGFGRSFLASGEFAAAGSAGGWVSQNSYPRTIADVNRDGRGDIVGFGEVGTYVALAKSDGTFAASVLTSNQFGRASAAGSWPSQDNYPRMLGDVNGDKLIDIVGFGENGAHVAWFGIFF